MQIPNICILAIMSKMHPLLMQGSSAKATQIVCYSRPLCTRLCHATTEFRTDVLPTQIQKKKCHILAKIVFE